MVRRLIATIAASTFALLAVAVAPALAGGGGCHNDNPTTEGGGTSVELKNCGFAPTIIRVPVGATVTWTNQEHLPHVVSGVGWGQASHGDYLTLGKSLTQRFAAAGVYPYTCFLHPGMSGAVIVGDASAPASASGAAPAAVTQAPTLDLASATLAPSTPALGKSDGSPSWPGIALGLSVVASAVAYAAGRAGRSDR